jgi:DNA-binding protein Fis
MAQAVPRPAAHETVGAYLTNLLDRAERGELENVQAAMLWDLERELYAEAIRRANGNQAQAARWLGVSRPTMREKLRLYGLSTGSVTFPPAPE